LYFFFFFFFFSLSLSLSRRKTTNTSRHTILKAHTSYKYHKKNKR
jgi:hypothetical protein